MRTMDLSSFPQSGFSRGRPGWFVLLWWLVQATLFRCSLHNAYGFRNALLRLFGAKIGKGVKVRPDADLYFPWRITVGDHSWIGNRATLYSLDTITIGSNCVVSQEAYLNTGSHDIHQPTFTLITKPIVIEDGAWVGARTFVNLGVTIHTNAVVGAMSNVTKNLPADMVCVGNPCKPIKARKLLTDEEIAATAG